MEPLECSVVRIIRGLSILIAEQMHQRWKVAEAHSPLLRPPIAPQNHSLRRFIMSGLKHLPHQWLSG
jgi:hypothetical protein